jgi:hypothetical protein
MRRAIGSATKAQQAYHDAARALGCEQIRSVLAYEPDSGKFMWKRSMGRSRAGSLAGGVASNGYWKISLYGQEHYAHRLAWMYVHGEWPAVNIDHIDGNPLNNRIENLRACDQSGNMQNQHRVRKDNQAGLTGVSWDKTRGLWQASIQVRGSRRFLGRYNSAEEAHAAYITAKAKIHPFAPTSCRFRVGAAASVRGDEHAT